MDDIQISNPSRIPLPPEETRLVSFQAAALEDKQRIRCQVQFTPFQEKPCAEISILSPDGDLLKAVNVIHTLNTDSEIIIHLPRKLKPGTYQARIRAYFLTETEHTEKGRVVLDLKEDTFDTKESPFLIQ